MEPPQAAALIIVVLSAIELFLVATYEATFSVLSRSSLEKLQDERSRLMLRIYEPRHRLRLFARIGEVMGTVALTLSLLLLVNPILEAYDFSGYYAVVISALGTVVIYLTICAPRRIRFDEDGEELRIPGAGPGIRASAHDAASLDQSFRPHHFWRLQRRRISRRKGRGIAQHRGVRKRNRGYRGRRKER